MNLTKTTNTISKGMIILSLLLWATCAHAQQRIDSYEVVMLSACADVWTPSRGWRKETDAIVTLNQGRTWTHVVQPCAPARKNAHTQQPKPDPQGQTKPERAPIALSPEASQQWTIANLQIQNLQQQQQILLLKAHVPDDYQLAGRDAQGRIVFVAPAPKPETAKAQPSPK